ncbi:hypothetical protein [Candidatus Uabimicrobium sp. HlEnr_7]|uniref:hypothetical protein n=1 Tax=Candidatus Uabimicrobium helgolandensis TaxID=3095367 RepID=UPI003559022B
MYREHQAFTTPDDNVKVWRYLDLAKFVSILDRKSLFFVRSDRLQDPFEGTYPKVDLQKYSDKYGDYVQDIDKLIHLLEKTTNERKKYTLVSSWNISNYESAALWKVFLKSDEGVAIQSTFGKLKDSFASFEKDIYIGKVKYIDYEVEGIPKEAALSPLNPFVLKRKSFEYEQEIRLIYRDVSFEDKENVSGAYVDVDLSCLIDQIFVAPTAPKWYKEVIESLVTKYEVGDKEVIQSNLWQGKIY